LLKINTIVTRYNGRTIFKSTGTSDKTLALKIHDKVLEEIAERRWFACPIGEGKTFRSLFRNRYMIFKKGNPKIMRSNFNGTGDIQ
jgi:hypothetical protein